MTELPRGYRPLAPRTQLFGTGDGRGRPSGSAPEEKRMRRASTACTECQRRRTRCTGPPECTECSAHGRECIFDEASDKRRKASVQRTQEQLDYFRSFVDDLIGLIRDSEGPVVQEIVDSIRSGADPRQIRDTLTRLAENVAGISNPTPHDPNLTLDFGGNPGPNNNTANFYAHPR